MDDDSGPSIWASMRGWLSLSPTALFLLLNLVIGTIAVTSRSLRFRRRGGPQRLSGQPSGDYFPSDHEPQPLSRGPSAAFELFRTFSIYRSRSGAGDDSSLADHGAAPSTYTADTAPPQKHAPPPPPLQRGPSSVLERLRSIGTLQRLRSGVFTSVDENDRGEQHSSTSQPSTDAAPSLSRGPSFVLERLRSIGMRYRSDDIPEDDDDDDPDASRQTGEADGDHTHFDRCLSESGEVASEKLAGKMKKSASAGSAFAHFSTSDVVRSRAAARSPEEVAEEHVDEVNARAEDFISRFKQQLKLQRLDSIMRYKEMLNRGNQN